jgi:tetrahydromethanopterin S-methyltransferase subunit F
MEISSQITMRTKNKEYKKSVQDILDKSSLQFLLSPFRSKRILIKIIWILFLLIFTIASVYYVILNILYYFYYDITTSIYEINEKQSQFPTISFCSELETNFKIKILYLWFNNEKLKSEYQNHLELYNDTTYGKCYRFNSGLNMSNQFVPIKYSKTSGYFDGLSLGFYSNTSYDYGSILIYIHNHTMSPFTIFNKGSFISSGCFNYFVINRIYDQKLEYPFNNCFKDILSIDYSLTMMVNTTIIDYFKLNNWTYSQKECLSLCRNLKFNELNYCNCTLPSLDHQIWSNVSFNIVCYKQFIDNYITNDLCSHYCPLECDSFSYETTVELELTNDLSTIDWYVTIVYLEDLKYTLISQQPKIELFGLISNLGGILGLFIGFSFISLLDIIEILAELIYIYFE